MVAFSSFSVRLSSQQTCQPSTQPFVFFVLPEQFSSEPLIPILIASVLPEELASEFYLSETFAFVDNLPITLFPVFDEPFFDESSNSFVWLFAGFVDVNEVGEQKSTLDFFAISFFEPFDPQTISPISASDQISVNISLPSASGEQGGESSKPETSHSGKATESEGTSDNEASKETTSQTRSPASKATSATSSQAKSVRQSIERDPKLAMKVFEQEVSAKAISNAKKNPKSTAKGNGVIITVGAYPEVLPADGKSTAFIVAKVTDEKGKPVSGRGVHFSSTGGQVLVRSVKTDEQGIAISRICSERLPKGVKKIVKVKAKTNPEGETTVTFVGGDTVMTQNTSGASVSVFWWSNPPNSQSGVCSGDSGSASGFAGLAQHVVVPSSPPHFVWHNFTKVTGDGHPWQKSLYVNLQRESAPCAPSVGSDQALYSYVVYPEFLIWQRFHRSGVTIRFNYTVARPYPPPGQFWTEEKVVTVTAQNAVLQLSPNNPPVFSWDPDNPPPPEKRTVQFKVETLQTAQVFVTVSIYRCHRLNGEDPVKTIQVTVPTNQPVSVTWDGTIDSEMPWMPNVAEKGLYAYDVLIGVQQVAPNRFDADKRVSPYMTIERALDQNGQQILEAEYYGYDDKGTEDTTDDDHLYFLRWYVLKCGSAYFDDDGDAGSEYLEDRDGDKRFDEDWVDGIDNDGDGRVDEDPVDGQDNDRDGQIDEDPPNPVNASQGEVILYDPDFEPVKQWDLADLLCLEHKANDGLVASLEGTRHGVLVPVPASLMEKAGTYFFVLRVWDNHSHLHKDHKVKPTFWR